MSSTGGNRCRCCAMCHGRRCRTVHGMTQSHLAQFGFHHRPYQMHVSRLTTTRTKARSSSCSLLLTAVHSVQFDDEQQQDDRPAIYLTSNMEFAVSVVENRASLSSSDRKSRFLAGWLTRILRAVRYCHERHCTICYIFCFL